MKLEALAKPTDGKEHECHVEAAYLSYTAAMKRSEKTFSAVAECNGGEKGVDIVVGAVLDALTTVYPRTHYLVGVDANILGVLVTMIPSWILDWLLGPDLG